MNARTFLILCSAALLSPFLAAPVCAAPEDAATRWVTAWATAPQAIPQGGELPALYRAPDVAGRTIREIVYPTLDGNAVRLRVSNAQGRTPLVISEMRIARSAGGAAVQASDAARISFGGRPSVTLAPGAELDSDPAAIRVDKGVPYAISIYAGAQQRLEAWHRIASQVNYVSLPGNHTGDAAGSAYGTRFTQSAWVSAVAVAAPAADVIAAIGDSITDGMQSSLNRNQRWPDALARRLAREPGPQTAVLDLGISGNRLLSDSPCYGEALVKRFGRDLVDKPGVTTAIVLIGINDINFAAMPAKPGLDCDAPHAAPSADALIEGYRRLIAAAREARIRIFVATLTPASLPPAREAMRLAMNRWIRAQDVSDGVIDFDAALRDPAAPLRLRPAYDSGDHIHPSDAGYAAMAEAVPLVAVRRKKVP
jgi:lysophospholipase L1-like esterase